MTSVYTAALTAAFLSVSALSMSAYIPQVLASLRNQTARKGTVLLTWWVWTGGALIEALYMGFIVKNWLLVTIAIFHLVACGIVALTGTLSRFRIYPYRDN